MLRSDPGEFRHPVPKPAENSRTVFFAIHAYLAEGKGFGTNRWAPGGGAEPFARLGEHACPAGGAFLPRKVAKEFLRDKIVIAFGVAESFAKT